MVREARKQIEGIYKIKDERNKDLVRAWATACPGRRVVIWQDRNTRSLRVTIRRGPGLRAMVALGLRDAIDWLAKQVRQ